MRPPFEREARAGCDAGDAQDLRVELLDLDDLERFTAHFGRQVRESGRDGVPVFDPYELDHAWDLEAVRARRAALWARDLAEPGWGRAFGVRCGERLVGHLELQAGSLAAARHRADLGMGVERAWHRRGLATRLLAACIAWARAETALRWIDLGVFVHNGPAVALYEKAGFVHVGTTEDRFRVGGASIDDAHYVLDLARRA